MGKKSRQNIETFLTGLLGSVNQRVAQNRADKRRLDLRNQAIAQETAALQQQQQFEQKAAQRLATEFGGFGSGTGLLSAAKPADALQAFGDASQAVAPQEIPNVQESKPLTQAQQNFMDVMEASKKNSSKNIAESQKTIDFMQSKLDQGLRGDYERLGGDKTFKEAKRVVKGEQKNIIGVDEKVAKEQGKIEEKRLKAASTKDFEKKRFDAAKQGILLEGLELLQPIAVQNQILESKLAQKAIEKERAKRDSAGAKGGVKAEQESVEQETKLRKAVGQFSRLVSAFKGKKEEQGSLGILGDLRGQFGTFTDKLLDQGDFGRTSAVSGQIEETALALVPIITGGSRVLKSVLRYIKRTLPPENDSEAGAASKIRQSITNAFSLHFAFKKARTQGESEEEIETQIENLGGKLKPDQFDRLLDGIAQNYTFTPEEQAQVEAVVNEILSTPAAKETLGFIDANSAPDNEGFVSGVASDGASFQVRR